MQKHSFLAGVAIAVVILLISLFSGNWRLGMNVSGAIGAVCWLVGAIFTGALLSGDRMRANQAMETTEDRQQRLKWSRWFFLLGLPNLVLAVSVYFAAFKS